MSRDLGPEEAPDTAQVLAAGAGGEGGPGWKSQQGKEEGTEPVKPRWDVLRGHKLAAGWLNIRVLFGS